MISVRKLAKKLLGDATGTAAVEFGLVLPVLAGIVIGIPDVANIATGAINMDGAVRAGVQYAMNGGTDTTSVATYASRNWVSQPHGASMTATEACYCDGVVLTCGQPCAGTVSSFITVAASATVGGSMISMPLSKSQKVRIQ